MPNISALRNIISNGWTCHTRQLFEQRLGKEQFELLKNAYAGTYDSIPFVPKASTKGKDIFLQFSMPIKEELYDFSSIPFFVRDKFKIAAQKWLDSMMPKLKNESIKPENILDSIQKSIERLTNIDTIEIEKMLLDYVGFKQTKEAYKFSNLIKAKSIGKTAELKKDTSFSCEIVPDKNRFKKTIAKLFGHSENDIHFNPAENYAIKQNNEIIGYFSLDTKDGVLSVGNYILYPQHRNTRKSMNAILTVRDKIIETAKDRGIKVVEAGVDANNPKLLGLYKRFGFQPNGKETCSFIDDTGKTVKGAWYNLIGYLE